MHGPWAKAARPLGRPATYALDGVEVEATSETRIAVRVGTLVAGLRIAGG